MKINTEDKLKYRGLLGSIFSFYHKGTKYSNQTVQDVLNDFFKIKQKKAEEYKEIIDKYKLNLIHDLKRKMKRYI